MQPLPLDPRSDSERNELLADLTRIVETCGVIRENLTPEPPHRVVERMTRRTGEPSAIWAGVAKVRNNYRSAFRHHLDEITESGNWKDLWEFAVATYKVGTFVLKVHLAALLHKSHFVGVISLKPTPMIEQWIT